MQIKTFKKLKDNKYKLELDSNEEVILYDDIIIKFNLLVNKELDKKRLDDILKENKKMEAYYIALKYLNRKMRTKKEIFKILKKLEIDDSVIEEVIEKLYKDNYLNDERYIKSYINDQVNLKDIGPLKIKHNLIELGFEERVINDYISILDRDIWLDKVDKYISKKIKCKSNLSARKLKDKIIYDLVNKGYTKDNIINILNNYEFENGLDLIKKEYSKIKKKLENKYSDYELKMRIKSKLINKGFTSLEIERVIEGE